MVSSTDNEDTTTSSIPLITTDTLQYRLDTQNFGKTGGQRGSLTRCAQKYGSFRVALSSAAAITHDNNSTNDAAEFIEQSKDELVREVHLLDLETTRLIVWQRNLERQAERNRSAEAERAAQILRAAQQIGGARHLASESLERRNCLLEYESLARVIHEHHPTPSGELLHHIDGLRSELSSLRDEIAGRDERLRVREAQYVSLIQSVMDLKQTLKEDDEDEASAAAAATQHGNGTNDRYSRGNDRPRPMEEDDDLYGDL